MSREAEITTSRAQEAVSGRRVLETCVAAWLLPGGGYFRLGRSGRGVLALVCISLLFGVGLGIEGRLDRPTGGEVLSLPATLACMGVGPAYFIARRSVWLSHGDGDARAAGYEAGTTFLRVAGLLNIMLILDAFDIAVRRKD
jgi:hypothetical protein